MATVTLKGNPCHTNGDMPRAGDQAPSFTLTNSKLEDVSLEAWRGRKKLISVFPSVDTPVCALSTKKFNDYAREHSDCVMLMVSADLPFAQARFCGNEGLENVQTLSTFRSNFAGDYGVELKDGPLAGLSARAILVLDESDGVRHVELVGEIADEPDYDAAIKALD
ncbi:MAG: thiol peroxidase [Gammaproteobacteria bacterium]|nr:thiol peroxidase [Gammaproteobacteria bacterium]MDH3767743.1 thiol peroxidase [Gammaproteobacteria bacterium]